MHLPKGSFGKSWVSQQRTGLATEQLIMLRAYMDDSGTHDQSEHCLIAGYWGSVNEWRRFEREWCAALSEFGVTEFHAKVFWYRKDGKRIREFAGWDDARHASFIDHLLGIIQRHKIYPFAFGVLAAEWAQVPIRLRRVYAGYEPRDTAEDRLRAIYLVLQIIFCRIPLYCNRGKVMHFFMDADNKTSGQVANCFSRLLSEAKEDDKELWSKMGSITFAKSHEAMPIQAADLLAYELYRYYKKWRGGTGDGKMRIEGVRAMSRMKTTQDFWMFDKVRMDNFTKTVHSAVKAAVSGK